MTMAGDAVPGCHRCSVLENELAELRTANAQLRAQLETLQKPDGVAQKSPEPKANVDEEKTEESSIYSPFSKLELQRYGRQMLVKEFGVSAQLKLRAARVLLIGAGGLGSPVAMYLAAMGVGTLGIVDDDIVDRSNLHRQVLHGEQAAKEEEKKVHSAQRRLEELNPMVHCVTYPTRFTAANALELVEAFDVVVDASDNVGTRYLVNDACAHQRKPLVSGSALGLEGQVTVFMHQDDENAAGCYRCLYSTPPLVAMSCANNGVIGVVPGVIGCIQAMEAVKVITSVGKPLVGVQCFYDAYDGKFRHVKIGKKRNPNCLSCGAAATESGVNALDNGLLVEAACSDGAAPTEELASECRISVKDFAKVRKAVLSPTEDGIPRAREEDYVLLDTRARNQFDMVHFPEAVNIPIAQLMKQDPIQTIKALHEDNSTAANQTTFVICRRGVDSVTVTRWLIRNGLQNVRNVDGGYTAYANNGGADPNFPMY
ncbi:Urmylation protein [Phytophthora boehmeriae]|uniref:Urmylation protein n=1 Tax=Phytophthora boehmeriae TaxID=109152 RepID=A0A8T1WZK1_9STRA|nr:Urmylation protein [Phytophthora boehmeriae]